MNHDHRAAYLLQKIADGDVQCFDELYKQNISYVHQIALHILQDPIEAEDICHDVFLELIQHPEQFDPNRGSIQAWLAVKTRSRAIDRLRKKQRQVAKEARQTEPVLNHDPTTESAIRKLERERLYDALKQLPASQREAITATYFHSMTQHEWAQLTGHPLGTVKSWVRYGMKNIKKQLIQMGWLEPSEGGHAHGPRKM